MATTITCDLCDKVIVGGAVRVRMRDGESPHNGSTMYRDVDCCSDCLKQLSRLETPAEVDDVRTRLKLAKGGGA